MPKTFSTHNRITSIIALMVFICGQAAWGYEASTASGYAQKSHLRLQEPDNSKVGRSLAAALGGEFKQAETAELAPGAGAAGEFANMDKGQWQVYKTQRVNEPVESDRHKELVAGYAERLLKWAELTLKLEQDIDRHRGIEAEIERLGLEEPVWDGDCARLGKENERGRVVTLTEKVLSQLIRVTVIARSEATKQSLEINRLLRLLTVTNENIAFELARALAQLAFTEPEHAYACRMAAEGMGGEVLEEYSKLLIEAADKLREECRRTVHELNNELQPITNNTEALLFTIDAEKEAAFANFLLEVLSFVREADDRKYAFYAAFDLTRISNAKDLQWAQNIIESLRKEAAQLCIPERLMAGMRRIQLFENWQEIEGYQRFLSIKMSIERYEARLDKFFKGPEKDTEEIKISVNEVIADCAFQWRAWENLRFKYEFTYGLPAVNASILDFYSLFDNLIKNAKESSSGEVTIIFKTWQEGSVICVAISDTGSGIAPEDLPFIFDQYWTKGKVGGIGLGLAIVKETVERYGGTISVESQVGVGTTFTVRLPVAGAASAGTNANMTGEPAEAVTARQAAMLKAIDAAQQNGSSGAFLNEIKVSVEIIKQTRRAFAIVVGRKELANQLQSCGFEKVIYKDTDQEIPIAIAEFKDSYGFDENSDFVLIVRNSEITSNVANIAPIPLKTNTDIYRAINNYLSDV